MTNICYASDSMSSIEYQQSLSATGLSAEQAVVYEALLKLGPSAASSLARAIPREYPLSRPMVYKILEELMQRGLVDKDAPTGKVATFTAKHPTALLKILEDKKEAVQRAEEQFGATLGKLTSIFNLTSGKPGIQFFEGKDGVRALLRDTLTATEEILTYADIEAIQKYIPDIQADYVAERDRLGIKKRALIIDTPFAREFLSGYHTDTTHIKLMDIGADPFGTVMQIYEKKISYLTLTKNYSIGIIITDPFIHFMHRDLFEFMWKKTPGHLLGASSLGDK